MTKTSISPGNIDEKETISPPEFKRREARKPKNSTRSIMYWLLYCLLVILIPFVFFIIRVILDYRSTSEERRIINNIFKS